MSVQPVRLAPLDKPELISESYFKQLPDDLIKIILQFALISSDNVLAYRLVEKKWNILIDQDPELKKLDLTNAILGSRITSILNGTHSVDSGYPPTCEIAAVIGSSMFDSTHELSSEFQRTSEKIFNICLQYFESILLYPYTPQINAPTIITPSYKQSFFSTRKYTNKEPSNFFIFKKLKKAAANQSLKNFLQIVLCHQIPQENWDIFEKQLDQAVNIEPGSPKNRNVHLIFFPISGKWDCIHRYFSF